MMIGMIVGIGPAATDYYYRALIKDLAATGDKLELVMAHADTPTLLANQASNNVAAQVDIYLTLTECLAKAGAERIAITSIAGHFCIDDFLQRSPLPVINLIDSVQQALNERAYKRVGLLGTKGVMATCFYGKLLGVEMMAASGAALDRVHEAYVTMAASGHVKDWQRAVFQQVGEALVREEGCECVLLAGTDLALVYDGTRDPGFPILDCALVHAKDIAKAARG